MHIMVEKLARTALLAAGLLLVVGVAPAQAQDAPSGSSSDGVLAGNVVNVDLDVPVTICGLLSALFGTGVNGCTTLPISVGGDPGGAAAGDGVVSGNALTLDADIPISLGGPGAPACQPTCAPPTCCVPPTTCCVPPTTCYCTTTSTSTTSTSTTSSSTSSSSTSTPGSSAPPSTAPPSGGRLPATGADLGHQLPIGAGLVSAGALFVWVSRRRLARIH